VKRKALRNQVLRDWAERLGPWVVGGAAGGIVWFLDSAKSLEGVMGAAVVLAGFSVAAFNLRFRLIDALQKWATSKARIQRLGEMFTSCRGALDKCICLFVITAAVLAFGKVINLESSPAAIAFASVGYGLFFASLLEFLKILRSFRALEDFTLAMMESASSNGSNV
jgi:hypothetical protein